MKIKCLTTFLDGRDRFEEGDIRTVSDEDGVRFVSNGWARDVSGDVATGTAVSWETDLDVHKSTVGSGDNHG